jgi:hypothetical protein
VGIKLLGTASNAKLLSIQGVLKLTIDKLSLQYVVDQQSYLLTLSNIALKLLGILKLPPGGNTNFLLFGNPNPGATAKSLGWYAAYNKNVQPIAESIIKRISQWLASYTGIYSSLDSTK